MQFKYVNAYDRTHHKYTHVRVRISSFFLCGLIIITRLQERDDELHEINGEKKRKEQKRVMDYVDWLIGFLWRKNVEMKQ